MSTYSFEDSLTAAWTHIVQPVEITLPQEMYTRH